MKAVSQRQRIATDALIAQGERDGDPEVARHRATIIGTSHGDLMRQVANQDAERTDVIGCWLLPQRRVT